MTAMTEQEGELRSLFDAARVSCRSGTNVTDFEPAFVRFLHFIEDHPTCLRAAEELFLDDLDREDTCHELISFCMHSLRMSAVRDKAARLIDPRDPRGWGPLSQIVASFDDSWEDADLYDYYRTKG